MYFFLHKSIWHRSFYRPIFLHAETLPRAVFTQHLFAQKPCSFYRQTVFIYTQKVLRTEVLRTEGFTHNIFHIPTFLHTDVFTQTQIAHRNLCTKHAFTILYTPPFFTQSLCFPFLITYLLVFPLSSHHRHPHHHRHHHHLIIITIVITIATATTTGVAFAPKPSWVAFAPKWRGMKWVQGRMWPSFRGECDPAFAWQAQ